MAPKRTEKTSAQPAETQCVSAKAAPKLQKRACVKAEKDVLRVARQDGKQLDGKQLIKPVQYHLKKALSTSSRCTPSRLGTGRE